MVTITVLLLDVISLSFLEAYGLVYLILTGKMKRRPNTDFIFIVAGVILIVLSYLYHSPLSLLVSGLLFSLSLTYVLIAMKVVGKW